MTVITYCKKAVFSLQSSSSTLLHFKLTFSVNYVEHKWYYLSYCRLLHVRHSKSVTILDRPRIFNVFICKNFFTTDLFQCGISIKKNVLRLKRLAEMETEVLFLVSAGKVTVMGRTNVSLSVPKGILFSG